MTRDITKLFLIQFCTCTYIILSANYLLAEATSEAHCALCSEETA